MLATREMTASRQMLENLAAIQTLETGGKVNLWKGRLKDCSTFSDLSTRGLAGDAAGVVSCQEIPCVVARKWLRFGGASSG